MSIEQWIDHQLHDLLGFSKKSVVLLIKNVLEDSKSLSKNTNNEEECFRQNAEKQLLNLGFESDSAARLARRSETYYFGGTDGDSPKRKIDSTETKHIATGRKRKQLKDDTQELEMSNGRNRNAGDTEAQKLSEEQTKAAEERRRRLERLEKILLARQGRKEELKDDTEYMEVLREEARRRYLERREGDRLLLAEKEVADREFLYRNVEVTASERRELALQKAVVTVAKQAVAERQMKSGALEGYVMPENYDDDTSRRFEVLTRQLQEVDQDDGQQQRTEMNLWEQSKTSAAIAHFGSKRPQSGHMQLGTPSIKELAELEGLDDISGLQKTKPPTSAVEGEEGQKQYTLLGEDGSSIEFVLWEHQDAGGFIHGGAAGLASCMKGTELLGAVIPSDLDTQVETIGPEERRRRRQEELAEARRSLPVFMQRRELLTAVRENSVVVVVGETGSGKTTQLPQYLHEVGYSRAGIIGCTQPRRVAAMSVASRVAAEMGVQLGREVGYAIRFEINISPETKIKYMTDGMLLRELLTDPLLSTYSCLIVDEAHERSIQTDILFGLLKDILRYRQTAGASSGASDGDFRLIISSATLEAEKFSAFFDDAPIFRIPGRRFPVDIYYTKAPEANFLDAAVVTVLQIHLTQPLDGDILVFLPGRQEIQEVHDELLARTRNRGTQIGELIILPIYSSLPSEMQARIFEKTPQKARKVVLSTNIAETSITVDNIVYVIDPGFCKQTIYNPKTGVESLSIVACSKAASNQRAGRAGRVRAGKCFRLYTKKSFLYEMEDNFVPEIQRCNLHNVVLTLKSLGIDDILNFEYMDAPPVETLMRSLELLYALGCLNDRGELTKTGRQIAELPLDPMYSKMILHGHERNLGCVGDCVTISAMLGVGNAVFYRPLDKGSDDGTTTGGTKKSGNSGGGLWREAEAARKCFWREFGDHMTLLQVYREWEAAGSTASWSREHFVQQRSLKRARDVREQLADLLSKMDIPVDFTVSADTEAVRKCVTAGFFPNAARLSATAGKSIPHQVAGGNPRGTLPTTACSYITLKQPHCVHIHPESSLFSSSPPIVVFAELVLTSREYMRYVLETKAQWLCDIAPHFYQPSLLISSAKLPKGVRQIQSTATAPPIVA